MSTVTVRLNKNEKETFNEYAKLYGVPLSTIFKKALEEKIEDEIDMKSIASYEEDIKNKSTEFYDHHEIKRNLGL